MFTDEFLDSLSSDPKEGLLALCNEFIRAHDNISDYNRNAEYDRYTDALAALDAYIETFELGFVLPDLDGYRKEEQIDQVYEFVYKTQATIEERVTRDRISAARSKYRTRFAGGFIYEFSDGDLKRVQQLLNELRDEITGSELFDAKHKQRVLNKLESLQSELHKKIGSLDKFWGLVGEAGVVIGKFGRDAKPFADRIKEIAQITWRTQARAEELPSGTTLPLLTSGNTDESGDS